ncbi:hypothetical protein IW261DRAFT_1470407 [Armillaria novae-zelandiae]|uniref:F-box domain-containing protein n=1 Tax=Armillaria novae-zelandiae TaxID=153914 RepID=A0AA39PCP1_9AGAR|nr:hypothetical protein IW261DRAFT_1470407 [Armillaria novae-zelandiae]
MMLPTSKRWTCLRLTAPLHSLRLFDGITHQLPLLETLYIKVLSARRSALSLESKSVVHAFCKAPHLRELSLVQRLKSEASFFPRLFALPLETISWLYLVSTTSDMISFLQSDRAKHMITVVVTLIESERHGVPKQIEIPVIRQACLRNLSLIDSAVGVLSQLQLPALQRLLVLSTSQNPILPTISEQTVPILMELTIRCSCPVDGHALANMLQWTPNLREMILETVLKSDVLFIALGRSRGGVLELVPHLETISLKGTTLEFSDADGVIEDMVEARCAIAPGDRRAALKEVRWY